VICKATFSSCVALSSAGVYGTCPAWHPRHESPDVIVQWVQIWRVSTNPWQFACSQFCITAWRSNAEKWGLPWLKQHNFVILWYNSTKRGGNLYILLFNSCVKFYAKIFTRIVEISSKVVRGYFFYSPCRIISTLSCSLSCRWQRLMRPMLSITVCDVHEVGLLFEISPFVFVRGTVWFYCIIVSFLILSTAYIRMFLSAIV